MSRTYTCAMCRHTFEEGWSEAEAQAEYRASFGELPGEKQAVVCDDCYKLIDPANHPPSRSRPSRVYSEPGALPACRNAMNDLALITYLIARPTDLLYEAGTVVGAVPSRDDRYAGEGRPTRPRGDASAASSGTAGRFTSGWSEAPGPF